MLLERFLAQLLFDLHTPSLLLTFVGVSKARRALFFCSLYIISLLIHNPKLYLTINLCIQKSDSGYSRSKQPRTRNDSNVCDCTALHVLDNLVS